MQDPKFEKQVQQQMEELKFTPSDAVWKKVDEEINKEKRRRIPFAWLIIFSGLLLAGGFYFISHQNNVNKSISSNTTNSTVAPDHQQNKKDQNDNNIKTRIKHEEKKTDAVTMKLSEEIADQKGTENSSAKPDETRKPALAKNETGKEIFNKNARKNNEIKSTGKPEKSANALPADNSERDISANKVNTDVSATKENPSSVGQRQTEKDIADSSSENVTANNKTNGKKDTSPKNLAQKNDSVNKNQIAITNAKKKKSNAWKIGVVLTPGVSNVTKDLFKSTYVSNPSYTYAALASGPLYNYQYNVPSAIRQSFSIAGGVFIQRGLSKVLKLSVGLNYHYMSTKTRVGSFVDSSRIIYMPSNSSYANPAALVTTAVNGYYKDSAYSNYTNNYHFIELPVMADFKINRSAKYPLIWQAGLTASYLISSNAIQYDPVSFTYYRTNKFFNRFQMSASTALMIGLPVGKNELQVGPQFQYGLTNLLNKNANNTEHLLFGGIRMVFARKDR